VRNSYDDTVTAERLAARAWALAKKRPPHRAADATQVSECALADLRFYCGRERRRSVDLALFRRALCRLSYPAETVRAGVG
jgi:hypothetical protein